MRSSWAVVSWYRASILPMAGTAIAMNTASHGQRHDALGQREPCTSLWLVAFLVMPTAASCLAEAFSLARTGERSSHRAPGAHVVAC